MSTLAHRRIVGGNIRALRIKVGLTQENLAEKASLHWTYLSDVERGAENVSLDSLARIAGALEVRLADLIGNC